VRIGGTTTGFQDKRVDCALEANYKNSEGFLGPLMTSPMTSSMT
jgi:hypothetical protein